MNILDCRWNKRDDKYGVVVEEDGILSGFLGIVFADQKGDSQEFRTGNITSWYLEKHLRRGGLGREMLDLITTPENTTYIATSPNFRSGALLEKIGWKVMEDTRLFWYRPKTPPSPGIKLYSGDEIDPATLRDHWTSKVEDHKGLNITPHCLTNARGEQLFFFTYLKIKGEKNTTYCEVLYASSPTLLATHAHDIASLLVPEDEAVLSADRRFLPPDHAADDVQPIEIKRFFKPLDGIGAGDVSFLYTEVPALDLKIY